MPEIVIGDGGTLSVASTGDPDMPAYGRMFVDPDPTQPDWAGTLTVDNQLLGLVRPRADRPGLFAGLATQFVGWRIDVDGVTLSPRDYNAVKVHLDREGASSASFTSHVHADVEGSLTDSTESPIGSPFDYAGAAPGKAEVDIYGRYAGPSGVIEIPLITGGLVTSQDGSSSPDLDSFAVADREARYDREIVDAMSELPQGHGLTRASLTRRMMRDGEDPVPSALIALAPGAHCYKGLDMPNVPRFSTGRQLWDPENRLLRFDSSGLLTNPLRVGCDSSARVEATITDAELARGGAGRSGRADIVTEICLTGVEQITTETGACETVTKVQEQVTATLFAAEVAPYEQRTSDGVLIGTSHTPATETTQMTQRVRSWSTYECGTLMRELVLTEQWKWPRAARYYFLLDPDRTIDGWYRVWLAAGADTGGGGTEEAYATSTEEFLPTSAVQREFYFTEFPTGFYLTTVIEREGGWLIREGSVKSRAAVDGGSVSDAWETRDYVGEGGAGSNRAQVTGDDTGVYDRQEYWFDAGIGYPVALPAVSKTADGYSYPLRITTTTYDLTEDGRYQLAKHDSTQTWARRSGADFLYADGTTSQDRNLTWLTVETVDQYYTPAADDVGHTATTVTSRIDTNPVTVSESRDGYLPPAEKKNDVEVPDGVYVSGDDADPKNASWYEKRDIEAEDKLPASMLAHRYRKKTIIESPFAENVEELGNEARRRLREGSAIHVRLKLAGVDFSQQPNTLVHVVCSGLRLDHDVEIVSVDHDDPGRSPGSTPGAVTTSLNGFISLIAQ